MDLLTVKNFFDNCAENWDQNLNCDDEKMNEILDASRIVSGDSVLDIACGTGVMFDYYMSRGASDITGIDLSPKMIEKARENHAYKVELITADASEYHFSRKYDRCFIFNAFPHFENSEKLVRNLSSFIIPGGTLTVAHDRSREEINALHRCGASAVSVGLMSADELEKLMLSAGFNSIYKKSDNRIYIVTGLKS